MEGLAFRFGERLNALTGNFVEDAIHFRLIGRGRGGAGKVGVTAGVGVRGVGGATTAGGGALPGTRRALTGGAVGAPPRMATRLRSRLTLPSAVSTSVSGLKPAARASNW